MCVWIGVLQDYLKWKGLLLHRYLAVLIDTDPRYLSPPYPPHST